MPRFQAEQGQKTSPRVFWGLAGVSDRILKETVSLRMLCFEHLMLKQKESGKEGEKKTNRTERKRSVDPYFAAVCSAGEGTSRRLCGGRAAPSLPLPEEQVLATPGHGADMKNG